LEAALAEPVSAVAWKTKPSWFIYGARDKNIPRSAQAFMAQRAKARETVEVPGASHVVMISHPGKVAAMIKRAAGSR
jgi:pimeloyl-ACP methyl ester carboxylesterase